MCFFKKCILLIVLFVIRTEILNAKIISEISLTDDDKREGRPWRLPNTTYPIMYHLHITTRVHQGIFNYTGNVTIELMVKYNTSEIVLHARNLQIQEIQIRDLTSGYKIENLKSRIIDDLLVIQNDSGENITNPLEAAPIFVQNHQLRLEILYMGVIQSANYGFHLMTYEDENDKRIYGASTVMSPIFARQVLPCYDEPGFKAKYTVRITHGNNYTALSNMPTSQVETDINGMTTSYFVETPPLSSYLLAFSVSNYELKNCRKSDQIEQRVFAPPKSKDFGYTAVNNAIQIIRDFSCILFDVPPYSLPKLDQIPVREHIHAAMENWGLITYQEFGFVRDNESDVIARFDKVLIQGHEIMHQWFGNLVTPTWWEYVWLKEAFSTYFSYIVTGMSNRKQFNTKDALFLNLCKENMFSNIEPVVNYTERTEDLVSIFNSGAYVKAPCILHMFDNAFGSEAFRKGVSNYLKAYAYSNANEDQLFDQFQSALLNSTQHAWNYSVNDMMKPWYHVKSLPKLTIIRDYNNSIITIEQSSVTGNFTEYLWIPLNFATETQPHFESTAAVYYMPPLPMVTLNLSEININLAQDDWLLVNIQGTGLYKVFYDAENMRRVTKSLQSNSSVINKFNRVLALRSMLDMWEAKEQNLVSVLELLKYLPQEHEPVVWGANREVLERLTLIMFCTSSNELYKKCMRNYIEKQYLRYYNKPAENFSFSESHMMKALTSIACDMDLYECLRKSKENYFAFKDTILSSFFKSKEQDICYAATIFNDTEFEESLQFLINTTKYWENLSCTKNLQQYEKLLQASLNLLANEKLQEQVFLFWANLLKSADVAKWNASYGFLKKQIPMLKCPTNATHSLCLNIASNAINIRGPFQLQYMELTKLCIEQLKHCDMTADISELMPNVKNLGKIYTFENDPSWQQQQKEVHTWLKQEIQF